MMDSSPQPPGRAVDRLNGRYLGTLVALLVLLIGSAPALAHQGLSALADWGNFGDAAPCQRVVSEAALVCGRVAIAARHACYDDALAGGTCDAAARDAVIGAARAQALNAVQTGCSEAHASALKATGVADLLADTIRACREIEHGVLDPVYAPVRNAQNAASGDDAVCIAATGRAAAKLATAAAAIWQRTFDHIAGRRLEPRQKDSLAAAGATRISRARAATVRMLAARCGRAQFTALYGQAADTLLAGVAQAGSCFAEGAYQQSAVTCPQTSAAASAASPCVNGSAAGYPCNNIDLLAYLPFSSIGGGEGNDVWGWTDPVTSREYALMGRTSGLSVVDVTTPTQPVYLGNLPPHTINSTWRGLKVYRDHAFVISEASGHGMQILDLTQLRNVTVPPITFTETAFYNGFSNCHTLALDAETGFAYGAGTNTCSGGLHIVDVSDPRHPAFAGCVSNDGYTHETECVVYRGPDATYSNHELCFSSNTDTLTIVDVTNKSAPVQISRTGYTGVGYTHQSWLTQDQRWLLMDDETDEINTGNNTRTLIWDVRDLDQPTVMAQYFGPTKATDHNLYIANGYVFEGNYRAGLRVLDAAQVASGVLTEVGYFDIVPGSDAPGYAGAWSNYPFFASGTVLIGGIESGLFVVRPALADEESTATPTLTPLPSVAPTVSATATVTRTATATATPTSFRSAAFVTQSVPTSMTTGGMYPVSVTMQNTGTTTWTEGNGYRLGGLASGWGAMRQYLDGNDSIAPGQRKTFAWTVTAPTTPGAYNFQWQMLQEQVAWFGAPSTNVAVAVASPQDAAFVSQNVPGSMTAGSTYNVAVTMQNTGTMTWTLATSYRLGSANPRGNATWVVRRVDLDGTDSIAPGQQKTFAFAVTAPTTPGTYNFQWQMLQEAVAWFGAPSSNVAINVVSGQNTAFVSQNVPSGMTAGGTYNVSVTMRNTGTTTWTLATSYRLGSANPRGNATWVVRRVDLDGNDSIAPGQQKTFAFAVTAPTIPGTYDFQWQMLQEAVAWFGAPSTNLAVMVSSAGTPDAAFVLQRVPTRMTPGQTYPVSVTIRNTGTATWTATDNHRLGSANPRGNSTWGMNRVFLGTSDSVAPGQMKTFSWVVTAPVTPGTYNFQWQMLQELVTWFGAPTANVAVKVAPPAAVGGFSLRFFGTGSGDIDRVKIPLDNPARPLDVGGDFTLEFWMKTSTGNASGTCVAGGDNWINGNILFDRDVNGNGDFGDYGVSLFGTGGRLAFGVNRLGTGTTICGSANVANGSWHHVAVTRTSSNGQLRIFVDGALDASGTGPTGDVSYRDGRTTANPNSDPFLVIGAEKHDFGVQFPSYHGWIDEVRLSNAVRYGGAFTAPTAPFTADASTAALYHFDEGNGNRVTDGSGAAGGPSNGVRRAGGTPEVPQWSTDTPFATGTPIITLQHQTSSLVAPTSITHCGDNRLFITEQGGTIRIWDGTQLLATPFLTVTGISSDGERGLLSMVCHPNYAQNGFFFVYYTDASGSLTVARYHVSPDPNVADPASRAVLLSIPHAAASNHNGGQLQFGSDGYLYAGTGDGGGGCDSTGCNAQRDDSLLGKMLRVDVNQNVNMSPFYGIPPTNPNAGPGNPLDEIWSKGLRNPWRFSFDRLTGSLFIGDVGQSTREEVDTRPSDSAGNENYGWKRMEGFACNTCDLSNCPAVPPACNDAAYTLPVLDYDHSFGCAITGGYVYRGSQVPFLYGKYLYGDLCQGRLWWAQQNGPAWSATEFPLTAPNLYAFGEDVDGEQYLVVGTGILYKIAP